MSYLLMNILSKLMLERCTHVLIQPTALQYYVSSLKNLKLEASAGPSGPVYLRLRSLSLTPVETGVRSTESC